MSESIKPTLNINQIVSVPMDEMSKEIWDQTCKEFEKKPTLDERRGEAAIAYDNNEKICNCCEATFKAGWDACRAETYDVSYETLKSQNEQLRLANAEMQAENSRLKENLASNICAYCWDKMHDEGYPSENDKLREENQKLRDALKNIYGDPTDPPCEDRCCDGRRIAKEALGIK